MIVTREVSFKAFHSHRGMLFEPNHPHEWVVGVGMQGEPNEEGFICDYRAVKRIFLNVITSKLEGKNLDDMFEYPTSENIAMWAWDQLKAFFPLHSIEVREKPHSRAIYYGPKGMLH